MKKLTAVILLASLLMLISIGCQPEEEEFDETALVIVSDYVEELTVAMLDLIPDLMGWVREPHSDNLPLRYDEERIIWLEEYRVRLEDIRQRYRGDDFPADEEIADWQIVVVRGDREWLLEGPVVLGALAETEALYTEIRGAISMISAADGELDMAQSQKVMSLVEEIEPRVEEIRSILFK
jgi:hypothetical protein